MLMIETKFVKLTDAASMLGMDEDNVLLAAAENKLKAWGLLNEPRNAERVFYDLTDRPPKVFEERVWRPMFVPLSKFAAGEILKNGYGRVGLLTEEDERGAVWCDKEEEAAYIAKTAVFFKRDDIMKMMKIAQDKPLETTDHAYISNRLTKLNQAATKFWANADRDDRGTHPENAKVIAWLVGQGFSETLAGSAATIIRPEWAPTGRKPEE